MGSGRWTETLRKVAKGRLIGGHSPGQPFRSANHRSTMIDSSDSDLTASDSMNDSDFPAFL